MDLISAALANSINGKILQRLPFLDLAQASLVAGCIWQPYLNKRSGRAPTDQINDYDIFYFDADLSFEAEDRVIKRAAQLFQDIDAVVEIRNQARIHLWYPERFGCPCPPMSSVGDAIARFPVLGTCLGLSAAGDGSLQVIAPYGTSDLEAGLLRANPACVDPTAFARKARSYRDRWSWLQIVDG
ncbi:MAG: nucleotidyltransferase family protein [Rhodospirillaceae bacterium]|nr:MAG: nucleotidyltransferase family protein [Rhodospirillaceae bacterium]